jgi:hypothetical protein
LGAATAGLSGKNVVLHRERQELESVLRIRLGSFMHKLVPSLPNKVHNDQSINLKSMNKLVRDAKKICLD